VDEPFEKKEKEAARALRKSRWWQNKTQNSPCFYCNTALNQKTATMDHVLPISAGGRSTKDNLVVCCKSCNSKKKDLSMAEWGKYLEHLRTF